jgi:uncharacterized membrane protein
MTLSKYVCIKHLNTTKRTTNNNNNNKTKFFLSFLVEDIIMSLVIIFLSYCIGCISTIGILICLYIRYGLYPPGPVIEQESFQKFHPLSEVSK